jgi:hypothetical protein
MKLWAAKRKENALQKGRNSPALKSWQSQNREMDLILLISKDQNFQGTDFSLT